MSRVGLVLGGGGIVGQAYHGGALAALHDATGWDPREAEVVVGTSAGAASGAELRAGLSGADMAARRDGSDFTPEGRGLLRSLGPPPQVQPEEVEVDVGRARAAYRRLLARSVTRPGSVRPGVLTAVAMSPGRLSAAWLRHQVHWLHGSTGWPAGAFWPVALDLDSGRRAVFGRDGAPDAELGAAVEASCAIPGVFAPVAIGDGLYIDGGGWSPSNADVLAGLGLDLVIVVSPMTGSARDREDRFMRSACRWLLMVEVARVRARGTPVAVIEPDAGDIACMGRILGTDVLDQRRCPSVVERVRASTTARVRAGRIPELRHLDGPDQALAA
jgi:NTE family protein